MGRLAIVPDVEIDRNRARSEVLLPAIATLVAMVVAFVLVTGVLVVWETAITGSVWTRFLALGVMYLLPPCLVGVWAGRSNGMRIGPPIVIGLTPALGLIAALGIFGGPMWSPFGRPLLLLGAVVAWTAVAGGGMVVGSGGWRRLSA